MASRDYLGRITGYSEVMIQDRLLAGQKSACRKFTRRWVESIITITVRGANLPQLLDKIERTFRLGNRGADRPLRICNGSPVMG
jgi:hypothetical protein